MSKAVILIGGPSRGTRFRPLSLYEGGTIKPLFPIAGQAMIGHHLLALSRLKEHKICEVLLIGFYDDSLVEAYLEHARVLFQLNIRYLKEPFGLGTGGALYYFRKDILQAAAAEDGVGPLEYFYVMNADICCDFPLKELADCHLRRRSATSLGTLYSIAASREEANLFGVLVVKEGQVLHYVEKPESYISSQINGGLYVFSPRVFDVMERILSGELRRRTSTYMRVPSPEGNVSVNTNANANSNATTNNSAAQRRGSFSGRKFWLEQDLLPILADAGHLFAYENADPAPSEASPSFWCQIKTAGNALLANQYYLNDYSGQGSRPADYLTTGDSLPARRELEFEGYRMHGGADGGLLVALENHLASTSHPGDSAPRRDFDHDQNHNANVNVDRTHLAGPRDLTHHVSTAHGPRIEGPVFIHPTAKIHSLAKIGPYVSVGEDVVIGAGVSLSHALVLPRVVIQDFSCVKYAILGWDCHIGMWARIEGSESALPSQHPGSGPGAGSHVRGGYGSTMAAATPSSCPSVTILTGNVTLADECMLLNCIVLSHKDLSTSCHNQILM